MSGLSRRRELKVGKLGSIDEYFRCHHWGKDDELVEATGKNGEMLNVPSVLMIDAT